MDFPCFPWWVNFILDFKLVGEEKGIIVGSFHQRDLNMISIGSYFFFTLVVGGSCRWVTFGTLSDLVMILSPSLFCMFMSFNLDKGKLC